MKILFVQTGGTIDKDYPKPLMGYAFEIGEPAVERILYRVHPNFVSSVTQLLKKDCLDITDEDRAKIREACLRADADKIIVTHGTDTIIQTAKELRNIKDKTVILTGAAKPEKFTDSDAAFNVGTAVGAVNVVEDGVYIAMNGRVLPWNRVKRDRKTGQFIEK